MVHNSVTGRKFRWRFGNHSNKRIAMLASLFGVAAVFTPLAVLGATGGDTSPASEVRNHESHPNTSELPVAKSIIGDTAEDKSSDPIEDTASSKHTIDVEFDQQASSTQQQSSLRVNGQNVPLKQEGRTKKTITSSDSEVSIEVDSETTTSGGSSSSSSMHIDIESDVGS